MSWGQNIVKKLNQRSWVIFFIAFFGFSMLSVTLSLAVVLMEYEQVLDLASNQDRATRPTAVTLHQPTGDVCVTDAQYSSLHVINKYGVEVFKTGGIAGLSSPLDGSLTSDGDFLFIGKDANGQSTIRRLNFMGEPVEFFPERPIENWAPGHMALTRNGDILALDAVHNVLSRHEPQTGALLWVTEISKNETIELQLGRPVEAPDGRIYLPSGMLHFVMVLSADGEQLESFGEFGTGPGKFVFPVGVAIGPGESILVLDRMRHKVLMFDPDHNFLGDFGSMGAGMGQFYHPAAIAASDDGKVYVAQGYDSRVQVFNIRDTKAE